MPLPYENALGRRVWNVVINTWIVLRPLFVLARVFVHGARMRADLEGAV